MWLCLVAVHNLEILVVGSVLSSEIKRYGGLSINAASLLDHEILYIIKTTVLFKRLSLQGNHAEMYPTIVRKVS